MDGNANSLSCLPMQEEDDSEIAATMFKISLLMDYLLLHKPFLTSAGLMEPSTHLPHFTGSSNFGYRIATALRIVLVIVCQLPRLIPMWTVYDGYQY